MRKKKVDEALETLIEIRTKQFLDDYERNRMEIDLEQYDDIAKISIRYAYRMAYLQATKNGKELNSIDQLLYLKIKVVDNDMEFRLG